MIKGGRQTDRETEEEDEGFVFTKRRQRRNYKEERWRGINAEYLHEEEEEEEEEERRGRIDGELCHGGVKLKEHRQARRIACCRPKSKEGRK